MYEPHVHKEVATLNGEAATAGLKLLRKLQHDPHPWDDLRRSVAVEHPVRDALWDDRNLILLLKQVEVQVYLGCDWHNVPLHLLSTFAAYSALINSAHGPGRHAR